MCIFVFFFFSSRRRHTRLTCDWSSDVCSSDLNRLKDVPKLRFNTSFDPKQSCAIANVQIEGTNPEAIGKYLFDKHHIFVTPIIHEEFQGLRITPSVYTTLGELDRFCEQMELIARKDLPS